MHSSVYRSTYAWAIAALFIGLSAAPAGGAQLYTVFDSALTTGATKYYPLSVHDLLTDATPGQATEAKAQVPVPVGFLVNMGCTLGAAPGGTANWTFTLRRNGAATSLTFLILNPSLKNAIQPATPVALAAGDVVALEVIPAGTPAATNVRCTLLFRK